MSIPPQLLANQSVLILIVVLTILAVLGLGVITVGNPTCIEGQRKGEKW